MSYVNIYIFHLKYLAGSPAPQINPEAIESQRISFLDNKSTSRKGSLQI